MKTYPCNVQRFFFSEAKIENFIKKRLFRYFCLKIHCGYTLNRLGGSNKYTQSMFWIKKEKKKKKNMYTPVNPILLYKLGVNGGIYFTDMLF